MLKYGCFKILPLLFGIFAGCATRPVEEPFSSEKLVQIPTSPMEIAPAVKESLEKERNKIDIIFAPDQSGKPQKQDWAGGVPIKNVEMEIVSMWDDGTNYKVTIQFDNSEGPAVTASGTLYAYDRMGRLLRTENFEKYFREGTISTTQYTFTKGGKEVRWILTLTGKK